MPILFKFSFFPTKFKKVKNVGGFFFFLGGGGGGGGITFYPKFWPYLKKKKTNPSLDL